MNRKPRLFVLCFPHLGMLDNWMPTINEINNMANYINFTLIVPDPNILKSFNKDNAIINISNNLFDTCLIHAYDDIWVSNISVFESMDWYKKNRVALRVYNIFKSLMNNSFFYYILMWPLKLLQNYIYKKEFRLKHDMLKNSITHMDALLYDIHVENNSKVFDILQLFKNNRKYSLPHALSMLIYEDQLPKLVNINNKSNIRTYVYAKFQSEHYFLKYKINKSDVRIVGIPRHSQEWIKTVQRLSCNLPKYFENDDTIVILSRQVSDAHLLFDEKVESVKNIKKIFIDRLGMKVVIKAHPNEIHERVFTNKKENVYEDVFGLVNYGITWIYSNMHVFALGKGKRLAISFNTGVVIDMIAMGVPCVEYIESNIKSDSSERKLTEFSRYGLVERVSSYNELCTYVDKWLINPDQISKLSKNAYNKYFLASNNRATTEILQENNINI